MIGPGPEPGAAATVEIVVGPSDLASAVGVDSRDAFPPVLATARMVALMEIAAARVLGPHLEDGEMSVGVTLDVSHSAATPPGAAVTAAATYRGRDGKLFLFDVAVRDPAGEVGRGTHRRAVVATERLLAGSARRRIAH
jgi:predicted thioesterase